MLELPNEVIYIILQYLSCNAICSLRATSSSIDNLLTSNDPYYKEKNKACFNLMKRHVICELISPYFMGDWLYTKAFAMQFINHHKEVIYDLSANLRNQIQKKKIHLKRKHYRRLFWDKYLYGISDEIYDGTMMWGDRKNYDEFCEHLRRLTIF